MAVNFDEKLIRVEFVIGEETITEAVTGEINVPAEKPDIERVIGDVQAQLFDVQASIEDGGVEVTGTIELGVIYVADVEEPYLEQPVHFVDGEINFSNFIDFPEAVPGMNVFADVNVRRVSYNLVDPRTIEVKVIIEKFVKVTEYRQITVVTDVTGIPPADITEKLLKVDNVVGEKVETVVVTGEIEPPPEKPPIERVLNVTPARIIDTTTDIENGGVLVEGTIATGIIYVADVPDPDFQQPVHFLEAEIDFSQFVQIPGVMPDMAAFANVIIKRISFNLVNDELVELSLVLEYFVKVTEPTQVKVVTEIVSDLVEAERELLRIEDVVGEDTAQQAITGRINIPAAKPDIERILEAHGRVIEVTGVAESNGVLVEGEIEANILYVADAPAEEFQQPVHFVEGTINFNEFINIPGTEPNMNVYFQVEIVKVTGNILNARTIEVTAVLRKFVKVTEFRQIEIVTDLVVISPVVEDDCPPSYIVYVVQAGDTLWKIARRYRTTVEELLRVNPGIDPQNLQIGQKICVPSKIIDPKG